LYGFRSSGSAEDKEAYENIVSTIANFLLQMVIGISKVCTERDSWNNPGDPLPPVLPLDMCTLLSRDFVSCLQEQRIRLRQKFSEEEVGKIDEQFHELRLAMNEHRGFSKMLHNVQCASKFCCSII
jgi:hypothetical protein